MTWKDDVLEAMKRLNKESSLQEIYDQIPSIRSNLGSNWKARVRATLEENSSESEAWLGKDDLFFMVEKGSGIWSLKESNKIEEEIKEEIEEDFIKEPSSTSISTSERTLSTEEYKVARKEAVTRRQLENILVAEYKNFLEKKGYEVKHSQVDLIAENDKELIYIEAKILKSATTAAHGLGQLLHYDYILEDKADKLVLLFDKKPNSQTTNFIKKFKVEIVYRDSNKFISL